MRNGVQPCKAIVTICEGALQFYPDRVALVVACHRSLGEENRTPIYDSGRDCRPDTLKGGVGRLGLQGHKLTDKKHIVSQELSVKIICSFIDSSLSFWLTYICSLTLMLLAIRIENFALIDQLELEFGAGLNVLTGETGAGKSIILEAIDAALGGKLHSRAMRTRTDRAVVEATFTLNDSVSQWLQEQEIDALDESLIVCSREMMMGQGSFRSRSRVNGVLVNRQLMDRLREALVEITAQGQTVQLGQPASQLP